MFDVEVGRYTLRVQSPGLPPLHADYVKRARLTESFDVARDHGEACFIAVSTGVGWPFLVVTQRYEPASVSGFYPGAILVPETERLFIGAGERLLAYDLTTPSRLWEDRCDAGFWGWKRCGRFVLMAAELEFAVWDVTGRKLWTTFVEPPWDYSVDEDRVRLDVMGSISVLELSSGKHL